jgi:hypothetical protein
MPPRGCCKAGRRECRWGGKLILAMYAIQFSRWQVSSTALLLFFMGFAPLTASAELTIYASGSNRLDVSADLRLRVEDDWDSLTDSGVERDDRVRLRSRARVRFDAEFGRHWEAVMRARMGNDDSQQSPHFTFYDFDGNSIGPQNVNLDLWYLQYQTGDLKLWAGRNEFNILRHNELFLHNDVTVQGLGARYAQAIGAGKLTWNLGYAALPAGMRSTSGTTSTAQLVYERQTDGIGLTAAAGYIGVNADPIDAAGAKLLTGNNARDYRSFIGQLQLRGGVVGQPVKLGFDYARNAKSYAHAAPDTFTGFHKDDTDGYVAYAYWGKGGQRGDWQLGYYYAYIEALAISSSYAQDDWVRWGSADQTRGTNLKGSEFRVVYTLAPQSDLVARLYIVDAIDFLNPGDISKEDGKRFRLDYNIRF